MKTTHKLSIGLLVGFLLGSITIPSSSFSALISRVHTFADGSSLTAAQLNTEFNNVVNGVNSINDANIANGANIDPLKIGATIAGNAITRDGSTGALSIAAGAISPTELASNAVTTVKILDSNVTTAKIANLGVTTAKINDLAVTGAKIALNAVSTEQLADGAVTANQIGGGAVTPGKLQDGAVQTAKLDAASVTSAKLATNLNLPGTAVQEQSKNLVVSQTNATNSLAIVRGVVNANGSTSSGEGFTASLGLTCNYTVSFNSSFSDNPTVTCSAVGAGSGNFPSHARSCIIGNISSSSVIIYISSTDNNCTTSTQPFAFIAIGQRP